MKNANPDAVVHWGDAVEGALILNTMRELGMKQPFYGCDRTVNEEFVKIAGKNAEGVVAAFPWNPVRKDVKLERFKKAYRERFGVEAETYAAHAYDGMNMLLWAINAAGLNRAKIRDVIAYLPHPWPGVTGDIVFSACLDDVADTYLATYKDGRWNYASRSELGVPKGYIAPRDRLNRDAEAAVRRPQAGARQEVACSGPRSRSCCSRARGLRTGRLPARRSTSGDPAATTRSRTCRRSCSAGSGRAIPATPSSASKGAGAILALEQENAAGGYRGKPFRLEAAWSESPWQAGVRDVNRLVYERGAWAVIGGVDGTTTHLAVQLALKSYFLLLSPGSTDATADHANVPWLFSLPPSDERIAPVLADGVAAASAGGARSRSWPARTTTPARRWRPCGGRSPLAASRPSSVVEVTADAPDLPSSVARALAPGRESSWCSPARRPRRRS